MGGVGNNIEKENRTGQIHLKRSKDQEEEKEVCWLREEVEHRKSKAVREQGANEVEHMNWLVRKLYRKEDPFHLLNLNLATVTTTSLHIRVPSELKLLVPIVKS